MEVRAQIRALVRGHHGTPWRPRTDAVPPPYNELAGQDLGRLAALSDGLFAIAMTLLVFQFRVPAVAGIYTDRDLWHALSVVGVAPRIITYLLSFLTLGNFWIGQQTHFNHVARADRTLAWLHLTFLAAVATMPFSTALLADFITVRLALVLYWANILILGVLLVLGWRYASRRGLVRDDAPAGLARAIGRRIVVAQVLYACGAALCVINTSWSIGVIVVVQLNFAIAPRLPGLSRL